MEFSMTEQQVPMFMRIMMLLIALQQKQLKPHSDSQVDLTATTSELRGNKSIKRQPNHLQATRMPYRNSRGSGIVGRLGTIVYTIAWLVSME